MTGHPRTGLEIATGFTMLSSDRDADTSSPSIEPVTEAAVDAAQSMKESAEESLPKMAARVEHWFDLSMEWFDDRPLMAHLAAIALILLGAFATYLFVRILLGPLVRRLASRFPDGPLPHLFSARLNSTAAWVAGAMVAWGLTPTLTWLDDAVRRMVENVGGALFSLLMAKALTHLISGLNSYYQSRRSANQRSITSFVQLAQLIVWIIGAIFAVGFLIDRSPLVLLSGLGALAAVLLLVFRDTILSLVAAVQASSYDLVRVGDWITAPKFGADGDVLEIGLNVVTVQNFDKTITSIPTYKLVDESFTNWRGMTESGARRIKRSLLIDLQSVRFLDDAEIERFGHLATIAAYIAGKRQDLEKANAAADDAAQQLAAREGVSSIEPQRRRLTNLGTFRAYAERYLVARDDIRKDFTLMVRQLAPTSDGLPLELYCFTATTNWVAYEGIQSDIFDHLIAMTDEFGLRLVQNFEYDVPSLDTGRPLRPAADAGTDAVD